MNVTGPVHHAIFLHCQQGEAQFLVVLKIALLGHLCLQEQTPNWPIARMWRQHIYDCNRHDIHTRTIASSHNLKLPIITTLIALQHLQCAQHLHLCAATGQCCSSTSSESDSCICRSIGAQQQAVFLVIGQQYSSALLPWPMCWWPATWCCSFSFGCASQPSSITQPPLS